MWILYTASLAEFADKYLVTILAFLFSASGVIGWYKVRQEKQKLAADTGRTQVETALLRQYGALDGSLINRISEASARAWEHSAAQDLVVFDQAKYIKTLESQLDDARAEIERLKERL